MDVTTIDPIWWVVLGVVVVVVAAIVIRSNRKKSDRTDRLRSQFKSEYDRTASSGKRADVEAELERRLARRDEVGLTDVEDNDADGLRQQIDELRLAFVDGPAGAARGMTQLVGRVALARGYVAAEEGLLDLVSVDHPDEVASLRRALSEMDTAKDAQLTEASRRVFQDARTLAERLLAEGRSGDLADVPDPAFSSRTSDDDEESAPAVGERSPEQPPMDDEVVFGRRPGEGLEDPGGPM